MRKPAEAPAKASAEDAKEAKHCLETVYLQEPKGGAKKAPPPPPMFNKLVHAVAA